MRTLEISGLRKNYGRVQALDGLDLAVEEGEFFVILGPSAAGKTTTLRCIAGIERADAGSIVFEGRDVSHAPVQGRDMAMVFQTFALYPHMTIRDNLAYPLREQRLAGAEIRKRVEEIAGQLRLTHTLDRSPATASGGEQQRVAIGRALIRRPRLLLLDEPLTNLDAKLRHDTRAEFKRLHRELGMTIIYATPDELEALSMGQRIAVLREGRIVQVGTPDELYESPEDVFVAEHVGSPRMNMLDARSVGGGAVETSFVRVAGGPWSAALRGEPSGRTVRLGVRPFDIKPVDGSTTPTAFDTTVHLIEPLGGVTQLDLEAGAVPLRIVLPEEEAARYRPGDRLRVGFDAGATHIFDMDTGRAIR